MRKEYHFDGFVLEKNPSPIGGGFTIYLRDIYNPDGKFLFTHTKHVLDGQTFTNNEAELLGAMAAAFFAEEGSLLVTDSRNTIAWIYGPMKARPDLQWVGMLTRNLIVSKNLEIIWRGRELNLAGHHNDSPKLIR